MPDYMLDTDFWRTVEGGSSMGSYSPITVYELWVGRTFSREEEVFYQAAFAPLEEAPLASNAARLAGLTQRDAGERTEMLFRDALIATTAQERGEVVVTRNVRDFRDLGVQVQTY